jgi:hypothetical protein
MAVDADSKHAGAPESSGDAVGQPPHAAAAAAAAVAVRRPAKDGRGGHNKRISDELLLVIYCFVEARQAEHCHTDRSDVSFWVSWIESVCPELRTPAAAKEAATAAREGRQPAPPKPGVISSACKALGISQQRSHAVKPQALRETADAEVKLYAFNCNHWRPAQIWVQDETLASLFAHPAYGLGIAGAGGLFLEGLERGPAASLVIMFNGG